MISKFMSELLKVRLIEEKILVHAPFDIRMLNMFKAENRDEIASLYFTDTIGIVVHVNSNGDRSTKFLFFLYTDRNNEC